MKWKDDIENEMSRPVDQTIRKYRSTYIFDLELLVKSSFVTLNLYGDEFVY